MGEGGSIASHAGWQVASYSTYRDLLFHSILPAASSVGNALYPSFNSIKYSEYSVLCLHQTNEPHHKKECVIKKVTFQSCRSKISEITDISRTQVKRQIYQSNQASLPYIVSNLRGVFQLFAILLFNLIPTSRLSSHAVSEPNYFQMFQI